MRGYADNWHEYQAKRPDPNERLRHHVTGAIERGEAVAITEIATPIEDFLNENQPTMHELVEEENSFNGLTLNNMTITHAHLTKLIEEAASVHQEQIGADDESWASFYAEWILSNWSLV